MITCKLAKNKMENEEGMNHLVVQVQPKPSKTKEKNQKPVAFVLAIDVSGSMDAPAETTKNNRFERRPSKLDFVKNAAEKLLDMMKDGDQLGIISFSDSASIEYPLSVLTKNERFTIKDRIRSLQTKGMTNISDGLAVSVQEFTQEIIDTHHVKIILLSDGETNTGITSIDELATLVNTYQKNGMSFSTVGVGLDYNSYFMENIATSGGGMFYHLETMDQLQTIFLQELENTLSLTTKQVTLSVEASKGIHVSDNLNGYAQTKTNDVLLGDLYQEKEIVFELSTQEAVKKGKKSITVHLSFRNEDNEIEEMEYKVTLPLVDEDEMDDLVIDKEVVTLVQQIMDAKTKKETLRFYEAGESEQIQQIFSRDKHHAQAFSNAYQMDATNLIGEMDILESKMMEKSIDRSMTKTLYSDSFKKSRK